LKNWSLKGELKAGLVQTVENNFSMEGCKTCLGKNFSMEGCRICLGKNFSMEGCRICLELCNLGMFSSMGLYRI
jgi:hypothetical protein